MLINNNQSLGLGMGMGVNNQMLNLGQVNPQGLSLNANLNEPHGQNLRYNALNVADINNTNLLNSNLQHNLQHLNGLGVNSNLHSLQGINVQGIQGMQGMQGINLLNYGLQPSLDGNLNQHLSHMAGINAQHMQEQQGHGKNHEMEQDEHGIGGGSGNAGG